VSGPPGERELRLRELAEATRRGKNQRLGGGKPPKPVPIKKLKRKKR
jgi:hypothetical protein